MDRVLWLCECLFMSHNSTMDCVLWLCECLFRSHLRRFSCSCKAENLTTQIARFTPCCRHGRIVSETRQMWRWDCSTTCLHLLTCVNQLRAREWQHLWSQCTSNKLYSVQPVIGRNRNPSLSRYDSVLINRLRIGHTRLTNSYLLKGENQPECQICHSPLTVKQILIDCTCFGTARQRYLGVDTLKEFFKTVESHNIIAHIKDTNFIIVYNVVFILSL